MADIQLSRQLFDDIQTAVKRQAPDADPGMVMQYLAAVTGYMLGSQRGMADAERDAFLDELCGFARHVCQDVAAQQRPQAQAPAGEAFGIWEPPND